MRFGWRLAALFLTVVFAVSTCSRAPAVVPDPAAEPADPEVGGGAGADTGPQTPVPTPTLTREGSPRLDATTAATAVFPEPTATPPPPAATATTTLLTEVTAAATLEAPTPDGATPGVTTPEAAPPATETPAATPVVATATPGGERVHVVQPGENLYRIGLLYGLSWVAIAEYNGITDPNTITVGQELRIPPSPTATPMPTVEAQGSGGASAGEQGSGGAGEQGRGEESVALAPGPSPLAPAPAAVSGQPSVVVVAVAAGDTLYGISQQYGVDWAQLAEANGLATPNQLYPGQLLKIPPDVPGPTPEFNHRVHSGETLSALARQYGLPAGELAAANGLAAPFTIYSGQTLVIPSDE